MLNARAAGKVTLSRGGRSETYKVEEAAAQDAVPVLRKYIAEIRVTRPYFDATPELIGRGHRGRTIETCRLPLAPSPVTHLEKR